MMNPAMPNNHVFWIIPYEFHPSYGPTIAQPLRGAQSKVAMICANRANPAP